MVRTRFPRYRPDGEGRAGLTGRASRTGWKAAAVFAAGLTLSSCGGNPPLELSPLAARGRLIANESGCAACHGKNGQGVTAPSWQQLYGEPVELDDGTTVIVDDDYLFESIRDPQAQIVNRFTLKMPANNLSDEQIALVIAYIQELR